MDSLNILIVEDEFPIAESLKEILEILGHEVVGIATSFTEAIDLLDNNKIDLALLDIQLKGNKSGIDLASTINSKYSIPYIFTTAFVDNETVAEASELGPYGYIVKPYGMNDINPAISVAIANHNALDDSKTSAVYNKDNIFIKSNSRIVRLKLDEILFIEAKGDYAVFKTDDKGYIVATTFKNVVKKLDPTRFARVHRSYIVNLNKVVDIEENNLLINDQIIPISRSQRAELFKKLNII